MNKQELQEFLANSCQKMLETSKKKNSDYSNGEDPFRNFRRHGVLGFLVRMNDKLARLESFNEKGTLEVQDESVEDTCNDLACYSFLLAAYIRSQKSG